MNKTQYNLALSFWKASFQFLALVENVSRETASQGNQWIMIKDDPIGTEEYAEGTKWSDHTIIIPLLFNLYHGIELLSKGFLLVVPKVTVKPTHTVQSLCREFAQVYSTETQLIAFFRKYTEDESLPLILKQFQEDNALSFENLYQALRYPSNRDFKDMRDYVSLKYRGEDGRKFFQELHEDIKAVRIAAVMLVRSLEPHQDTGHQMKKNIPSKKEPFRVYENTEFTLAELQTAYRDGLVDEETLIYLQEKQKHCPLKECDFYNEVIGQKVTGKG